MPEAAPEPRGQNLCLFQAYKDVIFIISDAYNAECDAKSRADECKNPFLKGVCRSSTILHRFSRNITNNNIDSTFYTVQQK